MTRGITPLPRAVPHLPLPARPAIAALSSPSPRSQSFRLRICACGETASCFPTPGLSPGAGDLEGAGCARDPGAEEPRAGQSSALLPAARLAPAASPDCDFPDAGWQERRVLRRFGADLLGRELRRAQSPKPAARWLSPLILTEKRKRLVGAATPGGVGRGRRGESRPKDS